MECCCAKHHPTGGRCPSCSCHGTYWDRYRALCDNGRQVRAEVRQTAPSRFR